MTSLSERRFRLVLHYDGTAFHGWQVQPGARTVQGELEAVLSRLADRPVTVVAAGRTDTGVHATGQVASALMPARWDAAVLHRAVNALLPDDVWVQAVDEVPREFHARFDAIARGYVYVIGTTPTAWSPFRRRWCWPVHHDLDLERLAEAATLFVGEHSFRAFAKSGQPERGDRCTVHRSVWSRWRDGELAYEIVANRFLHRMVRYIVGTMVDVARGVRPIDDVVALLAGESGLETSPPAPPSGLYLARVYYSPGLWQAEASLTEALP